MEQATLVGAVALVVALLGPLAAGATMAFRAKVIGVTDGDTLTVLRDRRPEKVRLRGIDSPEQGQSFGERAKQFTSAMAFGQDVMVQVADRDRYGRAVAEIILADGRNLNREIVRAGYAWWARRYSRDPSLASLEAAARRARVGLWADPHAQPPWEWRRSRHRTTAER